MGIGLSEPELTGSDLTGSDLTGSDLTGSGPGGLVLARSFFARPATAVAPELLGCVLWHQRSDGLVAVAITEVEAYAGESDPASHAFRGRTARNAVMFGPPGHVYVYFTYGMHFCMNLVCQPEGKASAVLLRAGRVIEGQALAAARRSRGPTGRGSGASAVRTADLARGPARLCQALGIDRQLDGADVCDPAAPLRVLAPPRGAPRPGVSLGPRVGISRAAEVAWRFWITGERTVSAYRPSVPRRPRAKPVSGRPAGDETMPG
jgi:DNA-3-methyladenine glycosylase